MKSPNVMFVIVKNTFNLSKCGIFFVFVLITLYLSDDFHNVLFLYDILNQRWAKSKTEAFVAYCKKNYVIFLKKTTAAKFIQKKTKKQPPIEQATTIS